MNPGVEAEKHGRWQLVPLHPHAPSASRGTAEPTSKNGGWGDLNACAPQMRTATLLTLGCGRLDRRLIADGHHPLPIALNPQARYANRLPTKRLVQALH